MAAVVVRSPARAELTRLSSIAKISWDRSISTLEPGESREAPREPPSPGGGGRREGHWLDARFPGARQWLDRQVTKWWIKGLVSRCREYRELSGREALLAEAIPRTQAAVLARHADRAAADGRAETHLHAAALAVATHQALLPFLRDDQEVVRVVVEHMGGRTSPALQALLCATSLLHRDPYTSLVAMLRALRADYGTGFDAELTEGAGRAELVVRRCLYRDVLGEEGLPQLLPACCCSADAAWLEAARHRGVAAGLRESMAAGGECCRFVVEHTV